MDIDTIINNSLDSILRKITERVKGKRIEQNLAQKTFTKRAGVGYDVYRKFEYSKKITLRYLVFTLFFFAAGAIYAQDIFEKDTVLKEINPELSENLSINSESFRLSPDLFDRNTFSHAIDNTEKMIMFPKFEVDPASKFRVVHETVQLFPYQYSFQNPYEGLIMQGVSGRFVLNDFFTANMNLFVSGSYFGPFQPNPYINSSLRMNIIFNLHERVQLVGLGQVSVREGMNPAMPAFYGGANYYGAGVQVKITDKFGVGFGVTNSYYRKNWTTRPYIHPVFYPF
jgi:hypothetical protein